ncbi:hypothetical protein GOP47_0019513 [Adiantum capillus-veneris]|uniref:Amidase domain-containing protein n=1 Tax=Adiantum capillus-veneris TaxID=13818 RepID=A0A9D4UC59_ADICA|nr:hypothetical protein GOP47_0019513 [Adiantum capillus-veneris]
MAAADSELPTPSFPLPSVEEVSRLSISSFAYELPAHQLLTYHRYVCSFLQIACDGFEKKADLTEDDIAFPMPASLQASTDEQQTSSSFFTGEADRSYTALPAASAENSLGAWTLKCSISTSEDDNATRPLYGKRVVIKDNIPMRGMPMYCGTSLAFTPLTDSPLVTRCIAAGATIVGKAQCEYMCLSASSHTSSAGPVRNPVAPDYHAGGSSSGCAALVASGEADLSIGCDQGGSCRVPGAMCGVVGCKPTHGLVPYTYIDGMYGPIDHAGPITRTVEDNALLLGVLAGWDGLDERASCTAKTTRKVNYCEGLRQGVKGMRIGVVKEGLMKPFMEEDVKRATEDSAQLLRQMGAEVGSVSIPLHFTSVAIWVLCVLPSVVQRLFFSRERDRLLGVDKDGKVYDRRSFLQEHLLAHVASWSFQFRIAMLAGEWLRVHFPESLKVAEVYKQPLIKSYASALLQYDVLLFPTTACKSKKLPTHLSTSHEYEHASAELLAEHAELGFGLTINTVCSNVTGHPALSVPVGGGMAAASKGGESSDGVALPIGVMLVGDFFQEASLYRVAYALEQARPWQSFLYCGGNSLATHPLIPT